ncbi:MAG: 23S rRNA (guanosine(2251)-2'-O)-methyltransferase RlmB [Candidatus Binatia bacterium]
MDREKKPLFLFGINPVLEKLKGSPQEVFEVLILSGHKRAVLRSIDAEARRRGLPVRYLESEALGRLTDGRKHQGVVAKVGLYSYGLFAELLQNPSSSPGHDWILLLDRLTDPRNFGALLRTAEGAGIRHVVISKDRSVGVTPTVVKTSAGAVHYLKIYRVSNLRSAILALKEKGYWVVGLDAGAKEGLYGRVYPEKLVVVLGAEGTGIRPLIRQECDFLVSIPMRGRVTSLNVAVAGAIFLYELLRQRGQVRKMEKMSS